MCKKTTKVTLLLSAIALIGGMAMPMTAMANDYYIVQQTSTLTGTVVDEEGEPLIGASVVVVGTTNGVNVDENGKFVLKNVKKGAKLNVSFIGYVSQQVVWDGTSDLNIVLKESETNLGEAVVTAMGIVRKATSLTYSTQQLKADDLMKVQDTNLVNGMEGKISGVTITPSAGGAGGASKILLRGNKSIMGNNSPLIVVDGVPMTNNIRGQVSGMNLATTGVAEGGDPLSMINPDDIESMNVLKGANAAALYGSQAANGVVMITTKKGKEGKLDITFNSNITADTPLLTPKLQNHYGSKTETGYGISSWGERLGGTSNKFTYDNVSASDFTSGVNTLHLRDKAVDDLDDFYSVGITTNNSLSLSGGTEKVKTYFSYANSYANGMISSNKYVRNTFAFRQNYQLWNRLHVDVNANYVTTKTNNRVGGGTVGNPIYDLYTMPRDADMDYYRKNYATTGEWRTASGTVYVKNGSGGYEQTDGVFALLNGEMQNWVLQSPGKNNPYWLRNRNLSEQKENRFYGSAQANLDIYDGLSFQARVSVDYSKYNSESRKTATTWDPADLNEYGRYWLSNQNTNELYTDYLLSYNKVFKEDWSVSATAGWVGHTIKGRSVGTDATATYDMTGAIKTGVNYKMVDGDMVLINTPILNPIATIFNYFDPQAGGMRTTSKGKSSNWDKAALATIQLGWKDMIYVDGSYRQDWYRAFKQFAYQGTPDNYGYFGFGASAILSQLFKMAEPVSYLKYRLSYSEVGNSIPNTVFNAVSQNFGLGTITSTTYNSFRPIPEKTKSFETGFESQFFNNALNLDVTYYNSAMCNSYLTIEQGGRTQPVNTGRIRNQGVELTVGYDWHIGGGWRWKTSANFSYNYNKIERTYRDENGYAKELATSVANGVQVRYIEGGQYGDMYVNDYDRWTQDVYYVEGVDVDPYTGEVISNAGGGHYTTNPNEPGAVLYAKSGDMFIDKNGKPSFNGNLKSVNTAGDIVTTIGKKYSRFLGNMNSPYQLSWSNTFSYKNFNLYILVNGRIGGKVISLTESYLDRLGVSQRSGDARDAAYSQDLGFKSGAALPISEGGSPAMYVNDGRTLVPVQAYYETIGTDDASNYVYNATNFRLRELSFGYTWRNLLGEGNNLSLSFIGRNLFFIYKDAPVDPDVSLSTANGLGGFEMFNLPSSRSFGVNLKFTFGATGRSHSTSTATNAVSVFTPVEKIVEKEVIKEVPVEKIVEKIVEKEVIKEVPGASNTVQSTYVVTFRSGSSTIENTTELNGIAKGSTVEIVAYASPEGNANSNYILSQQRADAVAEYLKAHGVNVVRTTAKGADTEHANRIAIVTIK